MLRLLRFVNDHILEAGILIMLVVIPLYPKFPLLDIPNTWVYVRFEDFLLLFFVVIFGLQWIFRKVSLKTPLTLPIFLYWIVGGISTLYASLTLQGIVNILPHLAVLHWVRRIEYMVVFFLAYVTIKNSRVLKRYLVVIFVVAFLVFFYGAGQKFLGFPAFSTMNEEFAKGVALYLRDTSRVLSTFAGHYDLAAYLNFVIPIFVVLFLNFEPVKKRLLIKGVSALMAILSFILLLFTFSRVSFGAYVLSLTLIFWLQKDWNFLKKAVIWVLVIGISIFCVMRTFEFNDRFMKTFQINKLVLTIGDTKKTIIVSDKPATELLPVSDTIPEPAPPPPPPAPTPKPIPKPTKLGTPSAVPATPSASVATPTAVPEATPQVPVAVKPQVPIRPIVFDRSVSTRFDSSWPRSIAAFSRSPIFGTGYSTLGLATDNDYLRALGETGLLGFGTFAFVLFQLGWTLKKWLFASRDNTSLVYALGLSFAAALLAMLFNALLIDVFEASKVAIYFWILAGIALGAINMEKKEG